jgi:hypothetical protein
MGELIPGILDEAQESRIQNRENRILEPRYGRSDSINLNGSRTYLFICTNGRSIVNSDS